ncbi:MAG: FAD-binding oxidoreductase, partial [Bdellovibrionales bacterium]|nr:FAD-binding oxidoreductase [Bdellovibrionales bacterium]
MRKFESWGRFPSVSQVILSLRSRHDAFPSADGLSVLPYGQGRSYGDCCLNEGGAVVETSRLDHFISFDRSTGVLRAEAGVTLENILRVVVPAGWFLPVSPGTKFVSLGGAIANDIHGKNHHRAGTFGRHVRSFELLRSDGSRLECSPENHPEMFRATIGGLGLTGIISWAEIQLKKIEGPYIDVETIKFRSLDEFFELSAISDTNFEYTVAWLDCVRTGAQQGRGHFMRGNHSSKKVSRSRENLPLSPFCVVPFDAPSFALNKFSVSAFNWAYFHRQGPREKRATVHFDPFFYPLDRVLHWNRIYGRRGFLQFQCVVPKADDNRALREIFREVVISGRASFLAVLKEFGNVDSPGILSFPQPGMTLCLDFPFEGQKTRTLFETLDTLVHSFGGRLYPAKDALMRREHFQSYYPRFREMEQFIDPRCSSS